ncbi:MAG TPA: cation:proton antiporter [Acidimicrobiales bacterium]
MPHEQDFAALAVVAACVVIWGLVSARLQRWNVSAPIAFVVLGLVTTHGPTALVHPNLHSSTIRTIAEVTLALVLFADASRVNARRLRSDVGIAVRLLGIGLPLTIGAGTAVATGLFHGAGLWVAAAIGAIVAPTDAALGAAVMNDQRVPAGVRRILNVESGLNDGIATPFVNLFIAGAASSEAIHASGPGVAAADLLGGAGIGIGVGVVGAVLLTLARRHHVMAADAQPLTTLALALFAYSASVVAGTNGFVAAFLAGMAFGTVLPQKDGDDDLVSFAEESGLLMSLLVWFIFGAVMLVSGFEDATWRDVVFALLALTVVRMVPVALSLVGTGLDRATVAFVGWFGPRGLASVVFGLIAVDTLDPADGRTVLATVTVTVALSVLLHGVTASPLASRYGARAHQLHPDRPEHRPGGHPIATRRLHGTPLPLSDRVSRGD